MTKGDIVPKGGQILIYQTEGGRKVSRQVKHYNLDMIVSVGYRIKSHIATRFRQWATQRLREYIVKGFVLDDERLKNPDQPFDYFDELLRRIQEIRTSERRFYQKMRVEYRTRWRNNWPSRNTKSLTENESPPGIRRTVILTKPSKWSNSRKANCRRTRNSQFMA